jgi:transcriptional regulator with XRE-family HTH domain
MNLSNFGKLVKALRHSSVDDSGNRWTRDTLSNAIHLTANQLGRLERGDRKYLDNQTLQLLAESFKLTNLEKKEFLSAAVGIDDSALFGQNKPEEKLNKLIALVESLQMPAYILDVYTDFIASNAGALNLFQIAPELIEHMSYIPAGHNMLNFIYSSELGFKEIIGSQWREAADTAMLLFRRSTLRYRHTKYFQFLLKELLKEKQFDIDWYANHRFTDHYDITFDQFNYEHPVHGPLKYIATETLINTSNGDLYLIIYNPSEQATAEVFAEITNRGKTRVYRIAPWPDKDIYSPDNI